MGNIHTPQEKEYSEYNEKIKDFLIDVTNGKYGGFLDMATALKLVDDLKMETSLAEQIINFQDDIGDYSSDIDPVTIVLNNATKLILLWREIILTLMCPSLILIKKVLLKH